MITVVLEGNTQPTHFESAGAGHLAAAASTGCGYRNGGACWPYPDPDGNAIGIQPPGKNPNSVFDRAGTQRLRYLSIKRLEPIEYVYAEVTGIDGNDYFFVLPRPDAEDVADVMRIMNSCKTWGEVRQAASLDRYKEILGVAGYGSLEEYVEHIFIGRPIPGALEAAARDWEEQNWESGLPADDDPFDPMELDAYHSGDYPPTFEFLQNMPPHGEHSSARHTCRVGTPPRAPPSWPAISSGLRSQGHHAKSSGYGLPDGEGRRIRRWLLLALLP